MASTCLPDPPPASRRGTTGRVTVMPSLRASRASSMQILRIAAELARQVARRRRATGTTRAAAVRTGRDTARTCAPRRDCPRRRSCTPRCSALRMSMSRLIGCVWMQRAGSMPSCVTSWVSPVVARSNQPPSSTIVCDHRRVRQWLERVVQIDARQRLVQLAVLLAHALAIDDQQRRAELPDQPLDLGRLEGIDDNARVRALACLGWHRSDLLAEKGANCREAA